MSPQDFRRIVLAHELVCAPAADQSPEPDRRKPEQEKPADSPAIPAEHDRTA